jgi:starvation-inducible outer membrane lipoprotein
MESRRFALVAPRKGNGENMKATLRIVVAACLLLLVACVSSPQNLILGRWEVENAPTKMTAEFNSDGTATISILGQTVRGTYRLNGTDELEWSMNGMSTKAKVKVTATDLELTDNANRTIKYKRK